jgi:4-hydroxybenzoate polyprenyltransferase
MKGSVVSTTDSHSNDATTGRGRRLIGPWEVIKVSRIGLIASHLWVFLLPAALAGEVPGIDFWIGAVYVTVPLGMLIYGWNDFRDADVDAISRRKKGSVMAKFFGHRLGPAKRALLPAYIVALHLPFLVLAVIFGRPWVFGWLAVMAFANWLYNGPGARLSRVPVAAELTATWIYLNILWLGALSSGIWPHWSVWVFAGAAVLVFQIAGAIVDIEPDRVVRKITFAVAVGRRWAASTLAAVVASKGILLLAGFGALAPAVVNFAAIPLCLLKPARLGKHHPSGLTYAYFVIADWVCLAMLAS